MHDCLKKKYELYKQKTNYSLEYKDFVVPSIFVGLHSRIIGTVVNRIDKNLEQYDHIKYFGCMLFFEFLTVGQLDNKLIKYEQNGEIKYL